MDKNFLNFFLNEQVQVSLQTFLIGLVTAGFLSLIIQAVYLKYSNSYSNKFEFSKIFESLDWQQH